MSVKIWSNLFHCLPYRLSSSSLLYSTLIVFHYFISLIPPVFSQYISIPPTSFSVSSYLSHLFSLLHLPIKPWVSVFTHCWAHLSDLRPGITTKTPDGDEPAKRLDRVSVLRSKSLQQQMIHQTPESQSSQELCQNCQTIDLKTLQQKVFFSVHKINIDRNMCQGCYVSKG